MQFRYFNHYADGPLGVIEYSLSVTCFVEARHLYFHQLVYLVGGRDIGDAL